MALHLKGFVSIIILMDAKFIHQIRTVSSVKKNINY